MSRLTFVCHWWGDKYPPEYVERVYRGVKRSFKEDHRFIVVTDRTVQWWNGIEVMPILDEDRHLLSVKGCFVRLRMFDRAWQAANDIELGDRVVSVDLDDVFTGPCDPLVSGPQNFMILTGANAANPCPYNGSIWMFRAGAHQDVWADFSLEAASKVPFYEFPDDQGWLAHKIPNEVGWIVGPRSGIYAFQKKGWPGGEDLPKDARMVVFFGWRDPAKFQHLPWVQRHWLIREAVS